MAVATMTKRSVDAVKPAEKDQFLWDNEISGFGLKVTPQGVRTYLLQYRMGGRGTPTRRFTIGRHGTWTPDEARKEAKKLRQLVDRGEDPQAVNRERHRSEVELAFETYLERFLSLYGKPNWGEGTYFSAASDLRRYVLPAFGRKALPTIRRSDVVNLFDALPPEKVALRRNAFSHTRKLFSWAVERGDIQRSPFDGMKSPPKVASRDRVLTDAELRLIWKASQDVSSPFGALVRLLMLTGQRRDEVADMQWSELDRSAALWTIPAARTKNSEAQLVPLSADVIAEIDGIAGAEGWPRKGLVLTTNGKTAFSGFSKAKVRLDAAIAEKGGEVAAWRLHDLRRTLATGMQRLGVRFEVTEAVLNHVSGSKSGVAGVYQRHTWKDEKRDALNAWAAHVERIVSGVDATNVVSLGSKRG